MTMIVKSFTFKNNGELINNDVVLPGHSFLANGYFYHFFIRPKTSFWRFGIRLSKTETIHFYHPEHRYKSPDFQKNYIDIHLGVGEWNNDEWFYPKKLHLAQYNINTENDHILNRAENYQERGAVEWRVQKNIEANELDISFTATPNISVSKKVKISDEFKYFKVFAWADKIDFELDCLVEITSLQEYTDNDSEVTAVKVGNMIFREGDMFDADALRNTNVIFLPASSNGSASSNILNRASELGIPYPYKNEPGSIISYKAGHEENLFAGYAYSVDGTKSSPEIISRISKLLAEKLSKQQYKAINIPLLGTGAGGLKHSEVAEIYDREFNNSADGGEVVVSIPSEKIFKEIKQLFLGKYTPIKQSTALSIPNQVLQLEEELNIKINTSAYKVNENGSIYYLNLNGFKFNAARLLKFKSVEILSVNNSIIENVVSLSGLSRLHTLYCSGNNLKSYQFLTRLTKLTTLDLSFNSLTDIDFLEKLKNLKALYLKGNNITFIGPLLIMRKLEILDLSENNISEINFLSSFHQLKNLNIASNKVSKILMLTEARKLKILDISENRVENINFIIDLSELEYLKADKNPFCESLQIKLAENDNHLPPIKNLLLRQAEEGKIQLVLPAKILLLGNHATGKSSLLGYIHSKHLRDSTESTHIIKIEKYPKKSKEMPLAIFFDFGGQDYYHGIYKAFLSGGSIYLILWNQEYDNNKQRIDSNGTLTQDFSVQYWLSQKTYLENEVYGGQIDPVLLIQTYADRDKRKSFHDPLVEHEIRNEFYVSLQQTMKQMEGDARHILNEQALKYLYLSIRDLISEKRVVRNEPTWYVNFLLYILYQNSDKDHVPKKVETEVAQHYLNEGSDRLSSLQIELDQLHQQGLILYYKKERPDVVWLNPAALAKYVHETILNKDTIKGGKVPYDNFINHDQEVLNLLHLQKVIFLHEFGDDGPEYIIPNFLPLTSDDHAAFDLYTFGFGIPIFTLKFKNFLPFGLINQIICFFGRQQDKKKFWRDQLLFTLEGKAKVLIHLDFQTLEIKVFAAYLKQIGEQEKNNIKKYIFYGILGLYWDVDLLDYSDFIAYQNNEIRRDDVIEGHRLFGKITQYDNLYQNSSCRPVDMYISLDEKYFINYFDLCNNENTISINSIQIDQNRNLLGPNKTIPIFSFHLFTNRILKKRKKVAISYSKKDLVLVNKFKEYLVPLFDDGLIEEPWYCTELIAGREWNDEIELKFNEADIIFFMISENLMATKYVKEYEIKNAIDKWNLDKSVKIIPILLVHYHFARKGHYDLSKFVAFPYTLKPVTDFPDQHIAWHSISESIRIMIENEWDPGANSGSLTAEQKGIFERVIEKKL
jgi:internalin A